ncbi:metal-dependent hydrolase [Gordoniibacillus kamchatkensis]|uniref:Putative metal-dependent hydrolase SD70_18585 n=1 Tax=Gordoniibacillus kamchatkensis TaxID=1590651 RepID=A0ABR5AFI3_9BACL|nr:bacillithiol transferase BstA [Paenibacillus sp. VKM B-2647]KIL39652.1 metal-dependent hydrolase [Paenibacillus sp. VKM B-2647]
MEPNLQYPIGKFKYEGADAVQLASWIADIAALPERLRAAVQGLSAEQLDTPYRPGGWTVRQVVHHVADSHMNSFTRFKLALTENNPTIKPYDEAAWAELDDGRIADPALSLALLDALHSRWTQLLRSMTPQQFERTFHHPENGPQPLARATGLYAWHGKHHTAHITSLRERMGW